MPDSSIATSTAGDPVVRRRRRAHPYVHIFLATVRRPWLWFWPVALTCFLAAFNLPLAARQVGPGAELWVAICLGLSTGFLTAAVVHHFAQLAAPPRGPTVPRLAARAAFAGVCVNCFVLAALAAVWPLPEMTVSYDANGDLFFSGTTNDPLPRLPFFAFAACTSALLALSTRFRRLSLLAVLVLAGLSLQKVNDQLYLMLYGLNPRLTHGLIAAAGVLFAVVWFDIATRRAESPFNLRLPRFLARLAPDVPRGARLTGAIRGGSTPWRLLAARRRVTNAGIPASVAGALCGGILALWLYGLQRAGFGLLTDLSIPVANVIVTALAGTMVASRAFAAQPALLNYDLLLPARRPAFFRLTGVAYLVDLVVVWGAGQAALFFVFAVVRRPVVAAALGRFWVHLPVALAYLLVIFGAIVWALRARHRFLATVAANTLCVACPFFLFLVLYATRLITWEVAIYIALPLAGIGVALAATARHRWNTGPLPLHASKSALTL